MMKRLLLLPLLPFLAAATLTLPSVTITTPLSTGIVCTPMAASYVAPLAPGTQVFACVVSPATFAGAVSISGTQFVTTGLNGNVFNVVVGAVALNPGTYAPGVVTTTP